jgi:hypothetical protein
MGMSIGPEPCCGAGRIQPRGVSWVSAGVTDTCSLDFWGVFRLFSYFVQNGENARKPRKLRYFRESSTTPSSRSKPAGECMQGKCNVRGLVHFSARAVRNPAWTLPENIDLTASRWTLQFSCVCMCGQTFRRHGTSGQLLVVSSWCQWDRQSGLVTSVNSGSRSRASRARRIEQSMDAVDQLIAPAFRSRETAH